MPSANDLYETLKRWLQGDAAPYAQGKAGSAETAGAQSGASAPASRGSGTPFLKEKLERDGEAKEAYGAWLERELAPALELLRLHFHHNAASGEGPISGTASAQAGFLRHEGQTTRGLMVEQPEQHLGHGAGAHLLDWCAERIRGMQYYRQHAEVRVWVRDEGVERLERIHLKPRFLYDEENRISDQRYGNITLEHRLWNDRSVDWKLINNIYHDRSWSQALPFGELVEQLLLHPD